MKKLILANLAGGVMALVLAGCSTVSIPPDQAAWAASVRRQVAAATDTHYVYVAVADKEELKLAEWLAHQQGKYTQRIKKDGQTVVCVFTYGPDTFTIR